MHETEEDWEYPRDQSVAQGGDSSRSRKQAVCDTATARTLGLSTPATYSEWVVVSFCIEGVRFEAAHVLNPTRVSLNKQSKLEKKAEQQTMC